MGRYLALILVALLIIGSGCHTATAPSATNPQDTLPSSLLGFPMHLSVKNVLASYFDDQGTTNIETGETSHDQSSAINPGNFYYDGTIAANSNFVKFTHTITSLSFDTIGNSVFGGSFYGTFTKLPYTSITSDTILIQLKGLDAAKNIIVLGSDYSWKGPIIGTSATGHHQDFGISRSDYYQCTDSTEVEIKIHL
jgi:hypothetical protein